MAKFVIVVDAQRDFMRPDGALYVGSAEALIGPMNDWLAALDPADTAGVLLTFDTHYSETYAATAEAAEFPIHCVRGEAGWRSVVQTDRIDPGVPLYTLEKGVFDMWAEPGLAVSRIDIGGTSDRDAFFDALSTSGVQEIDVLGVAADYCVRWAVEGLVARGFRVTVHAALTRGISRQIDEVVADEWPDSGVTLEVA
ncbi:MAG TPA: isochorismatase family protein [Sphingomonas sp.]|jgi:nicotinamidase/pyrazinamidase